MNLSVKLDDETLAWLAGKARLQQSSMSDVVASILHLERMHEASLSGVTRRPIPGFPGYDVAGDGTGEIRNIQKNPPRVVPWRELNGYRVVSVMREGKQRTLGVHRAVCLAFHGPPPSPKAIVSHEPDPSKSNVHPNNLRWSDNVNNFLRYQDDIIEAALEKSEGNISEAARSLGMQRSSLGRILRTRKSFSQG